MNFKAYYNSIFLIVFTLLQFFSFKYLPDDVAGYLTSFAAFSILGIFLYLRIVKKRKHNTHPIDKAIWLFILSLFLGAFCASIYWNQSFLESFIGTKYYYVYFIYFIFIAISFPKVKVEKLFLVFFYGSIIVFIINALTFPEVLFAWRSETRREGISFFFYGQGFTALGCFYFFNKYFEKRKWIYFFWFVLSFVCLFLLTRSRNNLIGLALGCMVTLFSSKMVKKTQIISIFALGVGIIIYFFDTIFAQFGLESLNQLSNITDDIRFIAHTYFLTIFQSGPTTYLFGNGYPYGNSNLQLELDRLSSGFGFYDSDLGFTGLFIHFGIISVVAWILIFYNVFKMRSNDNSNGHVYIKSYFAMVLSTALTGFSIFDPGYMPATVLALYIFRVETIKTNNKILNVQ